MAICLRCQSKDIVKNAYIHNRKQNHKCKEIVGVHVGERSEKVAREHWASLPVVYCLPYNFT